jgi:hypothetical protein
MSDEKKIEVAKQYVDKQLETMKKYGSAPSKMSAEEYKSLIYQVAENIKTDS